MYELAQPSSIGPQPAVSTASYGLAPASMPQAEISAPTNDAELRTLLQRGAVTVQSLQGKAQQDYSDAMFRALSSYAQASPQSQLAARALSSAKEHAPAGHVFPKTAVGPQPATPAPASPAAVLPGAPAGSIPVASPDYQGRPEMPALQTGKMDKIHSNPYRLYER